MQGNKWNELKSSLKSVLEKISSSSNQHLVSIINFSDSAFCEYKMANPDSINLPSLTFTGGGTDFGNALNEAVNLMQQDNSNLNIVLSFMTDGEDSYPSNEIQSMKKYVNSNLTNRTFKFYGLGFMCENENVVKMAKEFGGETTYTVININKT